MSIGTGKKLISGGQAGFSLLETMVAITILMMTIVGPLALASRGIVFADYVKDEITGFYLAQEAMEAIRNIRDSNNKNNLGWLNTIKDECMIDVAGKLSGRSCKIDIWNFDQPGHGLKKCEVDVDACERLKVIDVIDGSGKQRLYGHIFTDLIRGYRPVEEVSEDSIFSRKITIKNITDDYLDKSINPTVPEGDMALLQFNPPEPDEINVTVEVSWSRKDGTAKRSVKVSENLFSI